MRTRATNFLQIVVLISGIMYMLIGVFFYISPIGTMKLFITKKNTITRDMTPEARKGAQHAQNINFGEIWLKQIKSDEILAPIYYVFRALAALLFVAGFAMILPLFDPLKYRGLIYFNTVIFPLLAIILFSKNLFTFLFSAESGVSSHLVLVFLWIIFFIIGILTLVALVLTKKQAKKGIE